MNKLINTAALALTLVAGAQAHALGVSVSLSGSTSNAAASDSTTTNTNISTTVALDTASLLETGETTLNTAETSGQMVVARVEATADMATEMAGVAVATADNFVFGTTQNVQIGADGTMTAVIVLNKELGLEARRISITVGVKPDGSLAVNYDRAALESAILASTATQS